MKEKIYHFETAAALTKARQTALTRLIDESAARCPWPVSYRWDLSGRVLNLTTKPVEWEIVFGAADVAIFAAGPLWARLLFTKSKRARLEQGVRSVLAQIGLMGSATKALHVASKRAAPRRGTTG